MKPKSGQYCRTQYGAFHKIHSVSNGWIIFGNGNGVKIEDVIIKDTPQELIQVDDLMEFKNHKGKKWVHRIEKVDGIYLRDMFGSYGTIEVVTKIFTLNTNGDYIKQWEASTNE